MAKKFLEDIYGEETKPLDAKDLYDQWAETYDAEVADNGYVTTGRCADALAEIGPPPGAILDLGCGTGLSGVALRKAGFTHIDGMDLSAEMLARAEARPNVYRRLLQVEAGAALPFAPGDYAAVNAAGVVSPDHAPPETIDAVLDRLAPGGLLAFSLNDHALSFPEFPGAVERAVDNGTAEVAFRQNGPHLPKLDMQAEVIVLRRL